MIEISIQKFIQTEKLLIKTFLAIILLTVFGGAIFLNPEETSFITCVFHEKTGFSCPACGLSRSFYSFSHFNLINSFQYHLMGPIICMSLLFILIKYSFEIISRREIRIKTDPIYIKIFLFIFSGLWICFFIIRFLHELL